MGTRITNERDDRVFVLMPTGRDAELVCSILERAGISAQECSSHKMLISSIAHGIAAILVAEEALDEGAITNLLGELESQPVWSDIPVIVFSSSSKNAEEILRTLGSRINATVVERPIRITMLLSAVRGALRARQRQYQARDLLIQLEQSDKQKDLFLATLSHELRTPLNSILGWIQLLRTDSANLTSTEHALDVIERNAKAQSEIISDILFVSRIVTGKLELKKERIDLADVINAAVEVIRPSADAKKIELRISIDSEGADIDGDADRLQQVILNLLSNAIKFTAEDGWVEISLKKNGSNAEIAVADAGRGIDSEFLPFVFERFRQADNTYTRRVGGLGLGLAIVRHLVELHGGRAEAYSAGLGKGATVTIVLPLLKTYETDKPREVDVDHHENGRSIEAKDLAGIRLMLVEDDEDSREMLTTFLESHGIHVTALDSAASALTAITKNDHDLLISDVGLPGQDGYDLIRRVRSLPHEDGGGIPAIALTGFVSVQDRNYALDAGFQEHLAKPVEVEQLVKIIRQLVPRTMRAET